jgi:hypothetical protein
VAKNSNWRELTIKGKNYDSLGSAAKAFGVHRNTLDYRLSRGWRPEEAVGIEPPPSHAGKQAGIEVIVQGVSFRNIKQAAAHFNRSYTWIFSRLREGATIEEALGLVKPQNILEDIHPELARQWHLTKNAPLTPSDVTCGSGKKVWWVCSHGHEWNATVNSRTSGLGCPYCSGQRPTDERNFSTEYPELLKEWDWEKNGTSLPQDYTPRSSSKVWWRCEKGHSWQATISNRTRNHTNGSCPYCSNRKLCDDNSLAQVRPDLSADWHPTKNKKLTPYDVVAGGHKKVWWKCKHGHEWKADISNRIHRGTGCPYCTHQTSRIEIAIYTELSALFENVEWRKKIGGYEIDIYFPDYKIGIELDGYYWHKNKNHKDLQKDREILKLGIQLYRLREVGLIRLNEKNVNYKHSEDDFDIIKRLLNNILNRALLDDFMRQKLTNYINGQGLINEGMYREIIANLPAPPADESLAAKYPHIAAEWAHDLNSPLLPEHFLPNANKKVWWRCSNGHTWKTTLNIRVPPVST